MHAFAKILVASSAAGLACGGTDPLPTDIIAPEVGYYTFTATWSLGIQANGFLYIDAATETQISYTFHLFDYDGTELTVFTTSDRISPFDDWILTSPTIQRLGDGAFVLKPRIAHIAGGYRCLGKAVDPDAQESQLTCRFSYLGLDAPQ